METVSNIELQLYPEKSLQLSFASKKDLSVLL